MHLNGIDFLLWAAGFAASVILLGVLFLRDRAREFPFFTSLIAINVVRTVVLYIVARAGTSHQYLIAYLWLGTPDLVLQLCVVYELALQVFRPVRTWVAEVKTGFPLLVCGSVLLALGLTWLTAPPPSSFARAALIRGNFFSSVLMSELFVGMMALSATVRLPWKTHVARIAQGLGTYSVIGILTEAGHTLFGMDHSARISAAFSYIRIASYLGCLSFWIVMLWRDAPASSPLPEEMRLQLFSFQRRLEYDLQRLRPWKRS